jgi:tRNA-2-methylthio-N6-dimethylallyladenosine synthase
MTHNCQEPAQAARPFEGSQSETHIAEKKLLHIKTYGCQMNVYDTVRMKDVLAPLGYTETDDPQAADLLLLNTCHIREKAAEKVYSELGRINQKRKRTGKPDMIGVAGCVAQAEGEEVMRRAPYVDMVFGPQSYHLLPEMVRKAEKSCAVSPPSRGEGAAAPRGAKIIELDFPEVQKFDLLPQAVQSQGSSAFVSVQEGCDKFCTFCVVPYTRGGEYSRPVAAILDEVRAQMDQGALEVTLLGQNVNAYHGTAADGSEWGLAQLIEELAKLEGLARIRYTTSHPRDMDDALIQAHADIPQLMPYLHLPVQAGSDRVLKAMNRKHTASDYLAIIEKLRGLRPDMAFSGDFIVGFPGETEADFEGTLRVVEAVNYAQAYSFKYSQRPGTPAATSDEQVPEPEKVERLARLQALLNKQQVQFNERMIGKTLPTLFERKGKRVGQLMGKSPYMQSVVADAPEALIGQMVDVKITSAAPNSLNGEVDPNESERSAA